MVAIDAVFFMFFCHLFLSLYVLYTYMFVSSVQLLRFVILVVLVLPLYSSLYDVIIYDVAFLVSYCMSYDYNLFCHT